MRLDFLDRCVPRSFLLGYLPRGLHISSIEKFDVAARRSVILISTRIRLFVPVAVSFCEFTLSWRKWFTAVLAAICMHQARGDTS